MSASRDKIKVLMKAHPVLTKEWQDKHPNNRYPPLYYWEEKGLYKKTAPKTPYLTRKKAVATRKMNKTHNISDENKAGAKKGSTWHPHYLHHVRGVDNKELVREFNRNVILNN